MVPGRFDVQIVQVEHLEDDFRTIPIYSKIGLETSLKCWPHNASATLWQTANLTFTSLAQTRAILLPIHKAGA
ncbi:hypothetical protein J2S70_000445 [Trueperella bonasi]|uniref:Uncharacterized protein n=1 Tax=Trueperella bonasi TaxID=312286 RepID=A0ABT9NGA9_9ACTO|nr:hypothetical protein [Trueperella bonasi]